MSFADKIFRCFKGGKEFTLNDAYTQNKDKPKETVRARIYDNLGIKFERIAKGIYKTIEGNEACVVIEGDGRDLSMLWDSSIDCIFTDHPWLDLKSNKGGARAFATYDCFKYTLQDFKEKARVLKDGCFLVEILPAENENNYEYLHQSELPLSLCEQILEYITYEGEVVLDSFAGSGVVGEAALKNKRNCILIEIMKENIEKIKNRLRKNGCVQIALW